MMQLLLPSFSQCYDATAGFEHVPLNTSGDIPYVTEAVALAVEHTANHFMLAYSCHSCPG